MCILVCDGFKGLPEFINTVWDPAIIQTCLIHLLLRNTFCYASRKYSDQIAHDILLVYTAATKAAAKESFVELTTTGARAFPTEQARPEVSLSDDPIARFDRAT